MSLFYNFFTYRKMKLCHGTCCVILFTRYVSTYVNHISLANKQCCLICCIALYVFRHAFRDSRDPLFARMIDTIVQMYEYNLIKADPWNIS